MVGTIISHSTEEDLCKELADEHGQESRLWCVWCGRHRATGGNKRVFSVQLGLNPACPRCEKLCGVFPLANVKASPFPCVEDNSVQVQKVEQSVPLNVQEDR